MCTPVVALLHKKGSCYRRKICANSLWLYSYFAKTSPSKNKNMNYIFIYLRLLRCLSSWAKCDIIWLLTTLQLILLYYLGFPIWKCDTIVTLLKWLGLEKKKYLASLLIWRQYYSKLSQNRCSPLIQGVSIYTGRMWLLILLQIMIMSFFWFLNWKYNTMTTINNRSQYLGQKKKKNFRHNLFGVKIIQNYLKTDATN